jgi:hypothetical protein
MKPFHFLFAVFLIANFSHANDQKLFERALDDVNTAIAQPEINASCPGLDTVVSCGNGVCESRRGENETTCGADCVPALIKSYNNQTLCRGVTRVFQPASIAEVQNIIRETKLRGENLRIVGRLHSANEQLCNVGAVISTEKLTRIIALEQFNGQDTVLAEAGVTLYQLSEWLHERNRSLGFITIGFRDVSIAGAAATGSHGSSPRHSVCCFIVSRITKHRKL